MPPRTLLSKRWPLRESLSPATTESLTRVNQTTLLPSEVNSSEWPTMQSESSGKGLNRSSADFTPFFLLTQKSYYIPNNVSTIVDLLEAKNISWATYQENMPYDAYQSDFAQTNYFNASLGPYTYYKRKHNPFIIYNSITEIQSRAKRIRNFNDFAADANATALPQYMFITPNL